MVIDGPEALGLVAGAIGAFAFAPQALKILRDKSAEDVSLATFGMVLTGALLWSIYGVLRGAPSILLWNLVAASLAGAVVVLKLTARAK
ncbi:MAG: hypothetical protein GC189_12140 [Alphaproteobacteria bacterium]|nr:hypothetical protein [Alphaproteobacteria bacterium]